MKNNALLSEERHFITKEFADTLASKTPAPYLRCTIQRNKLWLPWPSMIAVHKTGGRACAHISIT